MKFDSTRAIWNKCSAIRNPVHPAETERQRSTKTKRERERAHGVANQKAKSVCENAENKRSKSQKYDENLSGVVNVVAHSAVFE